MSTFDEVNKKVHEYIQQIAEDEGLELNSISDESSLRDDLGLSSISLATLGAHLEMEFNVDPFSSNLALASQINTVKDISEVYFQSIKVMKGEENKS